MEFGGRNAIYVMEVSHIFCPINNVIIVIVNTTIVNFFS